MNKAFKVHKIEGYIVNLYLIEYSDRMLLLDCGSVNDVNRIVKYCEEVLKRPVGDIKLAIVSHCHPDHAGGAARLRKKYGIPLAAHPRIDYWYAGAGGCVQHLLDCYLATFVARRRKLKLERILSVRRVKPDYFLDDNALLPFFPDWQALYIPGHTSGDIALYNKETGILYPGDCVTEVGGKLVLPVPISFPQAMAASFDRLARLDIKQLILAHGNTSEDPRQVIDYLHTLIDKPRNQMSVSAHRMQVFSPEYRRSIKKAR
ncbi:MAG: MBL fold metallo-hydrolase [Syntrophomonadaceae bacterium]|nr:MBL fold metallo-hydrolase [Syntrophomonadaceae bacterium]